MRLIVRDFSALKSVDILIEDFTVIIGEQASGKSLICKILFFLRDILPDQIKDGIMSGTSLRGIHSRLTKEFSIIFPPYSWRDRAFEVRAENILPRDSREVDITISYNPGGNGVRFALSPEMRREYKKIVAAYKEEKATSEATRREEGVDLTVREFSPFRILWRAIRKSNCPKFFEDVIYIPSGRSFFSAIKDNIFGFLSENIGIDPFLKKFGNYYEYAKNVFEYGEDKDISSMKDFDHISRSVVKGEYSLEKNEEWIVSDRGRVTLANASSGQQEALPLLLVLRQELGSATKFSQRSVVVEEPEAHLFPASQRAIVNLLFLIKREAPGTKVIVTTHSPYILACINNGLLGAGNSVKVASYFVADGQSTDIRDPDSGLVNGVDLDKISSQIADEFFEALERLK